MELYPGNEEASELALMVLPHYRYDFSGYYRVDYAAIKTISTDYGHRERVQNTRKLNALVDHLNMRLSTERDKKEKEEEMKQKLKDRNHMLHDGQRGKISKS